MKSHVDEIKKLLKHMLMNWQVDEMTIQLNYKYNWMKLYFNKMSVLQNGNLTKW